VVRVKTPLISPLIQLFRGFLFLYVSSFHKNTDSSSREETLEFAIGRLSIIHRKLLTISIKYGDDRSHQKQNMNVFRDVAPCSPVEIDWHLIALMTVTPLKHRLISTTLLGTIRQPSPHASPWQPEISHQKSSSECDFGFSQSNLHATGTAFYIFFSK
jgi:hypothetical protein